MGAVVAALLALVSAAAANHNLIQHVSTGPTDPNASEDIFQGLLSNDGHVAVFATNQRLVAADTDSAQDIYQWRDGVTDARLSRRDQRQRRDPGTLAVPAASLPRALGRRFQDLVHDQRAARAGGHRPFSDVYERYLGHTYLVSTGSMNANQPSPSVFEGASPDGTRVYFGTIEPLTVDDLDHCKDIYERSAGVTTLITKGKLTCPNATAVGMAGYADTPDGPAVLFGTSFRMLAEDTDDLNDYYENVGGEIRLLTQGPATTGTADAPRLKRFSPDANALLFVTTQPLTADDTDTRLDAYANVNGVLTRVSKGPTGGNGAFDVLDPDTTDYFGIGDAGHSFFFSTPEQLTANDHDSQSDLYEYADGTARLIGDDGIFRAARLTPLRFSSRATSACCLKTTILLRPLRGSGRRGDAGESGEAAADSMLAKPGDAGTSSDFRACRSW